MVITWSIVDLKVSGNFLLLQRQMKMKQTFNKTFKLIFAGITVFTIAAFLGTIIQSLVTLLRDGRSHLLLSLCEESHISNPETNTILAIISLLILILGIMGGMLFLVPYIGHGLSNMSVILWRLFRGKTGSKTHYKTQLNTHSSETFH